MNGFTIWRVGGSSECNLVHRSTSSSICGPGDNVFTARSETGFGTNGPSFISTLSGTATATLNGVLVECFGPGNNVSLGNRVGGSNLSIIGQYHRSKCEGAVIHFSVALSSYQLYWHSLVINLQQVSGVCTEHCTILNRNYVYSVNRGHVNSMLYVKVNTTPYTGIPERPHSRVTLLRLNQQRKYSSFGRSFGSQKHPTNCVSDCLSMVEVHPAKSPIFMLAVSCLKL